MYLSTRVERKILSDQLLPDVSLDIDVLQVSTSVICENRDYVK